MQQWVVARTGTGKLAVFFDEYFDGNASEGKAEHYNGDDGKLKHNSIDFAKAKVQKHHRRRPISHAKACEKTGQDR